MLDSLRFSLKKILKRTKNVQPLPVAPDKKEIIVSNKISSDGEIPKIIWTYWEGEIPSLVKICYDSMKINQSDFQLNILNKNNLTDFLDTDFSVYSYERPSFFSDHIRLLLLEKYGGIWIDASILVTEPLNWIAELSSHYKVSFIANYNTSLMIPEGKPMIESFFLASSPNNSLVKESLRVWENWLTSSDALNFFKKKPNYRLLKQNFTPFLEKYLYIHMCFQEVLNSQDCNYLVINSKDDTLFYQSHLTTEDHNLELAENLLLKERPSKIARLIKITFHERARISTFIDHKCYRKDSLLAMYINNNQ